MAAQAVEIIVLRRPIRQIADMALRGTGCGCVGLDPNLLPVEQPVQIRLYGR